VRPGSSGDISGRAGHTSAPRCGGTTWPAHRRRSRRRSYRRRHTSGPDPERRFSIGRSEPSMHRCGPKVPVTSSSQGRIWQSAQSLKIVPMASIRIATFPAAAKPARRCMCPARPPPPGRTAGQLKWSTAILRAGTVPPAWSRCPAGQTPPRRRRRLFIVEANAACCLNVPPDCRCPGQDKGSGTACGRT